MTGCEDKPPMNYDISANSQFDIQISAKIHRRFPHMKLKNAIILLITATIWGVAFVAQSVGMEYIGPFTFGGVRMLLGALVLLPFVILTEKKAKKISVQTDASIEYSSKCDSSNFKPVLKGGISCGILLFLASSFQQTGIQYTTPGKAGFITALYIVLVPITGLLFRKKCSPMIWFSVFLAIIGFYLLTMNEGLSLGKGDFLLLICAIFFTFHILAIDHFSPMVNGITMSCIQFFTAGILSISCAFIFETPRLSALSAAYIPVLYAGILSCGVGYTFQIIGQKGMNPTISSLIMSLESVISVIAGAIILNEYLTVRELAGCIVIFTAIILAQLPWANLTKRNTHN